MARTAVALLCFAPRLAGGEDASVLVQSAARVEAGVEVHARFSQFPHPPKPQQGFQMPMLPPLPTPKPFDCEKYPFMCQAPFNCQRSTPLEQARTTFTMATQDGHANLHLWCASPQYADTLVKNCLVDKDLKRSGWAMFNATLRGAFGPITKELDGSYCFIEGHCSNEAVTEHTTLEEAEQMCDERYGHDGWAVSFGCKDLMEAQWMFGATTPNGFKHTKVTRAFLKAACAMGNFHCDVMYCKETYCKNPYFVSKYGHLLPNAPGHLIQDRGWLA